MKYIAPLLLIFLSLPAVAQPPPPGGGGGGLSAVEDDPAPVLGGDLSVKGKKICDNDFDTCMYLEQTTDGDEILFTSAGQDVFQAYNTGTGTSFIVPGSGVQSAEIFEVRSNAPYELFRVGSEEILINAPGAGTGIDAIYFYSDASGLSSQRMELRWVGASPVLGNNTTSEFMIQSNGDLTLVGNGSGDDVILRSNGVDSVKATEAYAEVMGCRDYGTLATAPTPNGACDRYYDTSGAFCVYNGSGWDKIGSGSCA